MPDYRQGLAASLVAVVVLAALLGSVAWVIYSGPASLPKRSTAFETAVNGDPVFIKVEAGDSASAIARRLQSAGVIRSAGSFELLARLSGADRSLAAGEYEFVRGTSALDAVTRIRDGLTAVRLVTIPEGLRVEEIARLLEQRGVVSASDFLAGVNSLAVASNGVDAGLLAGHPASLGLEGYLYPATYSFARNVTPQEVAAKMLQALADRFAADLREEARQQGLSVHEVLTLASIVEREAVMAEERPIIASVYRNRLKDGMALQADPTVQYAVTARSGSIASFGYWKKELTVQDLQFDSAFNTYVKAGLPPGPIASPGIDSIIAVIRPAQTRFYYFVARNDGSHAFAETFAQHERNVQLYQR